MFHGAHALIQKLLKMVSYPSVKNSRNNYSSGDVDEAITKIQTGEISQTKAVREYGIPCRMIAHKCNNKRENVE